MGRDDRKEPGAADVDPGRTMPVALTRVVGRAASEDDRNDGKRAPDGDVGENEGAGGGHGGGNGKAPWIELIAALRADLLVDARRLCRNHYDADDLVQRTIERMLRSWRQLEDPARLGAWARKILTNIFLDDVRRGRRHDFVPIDDSEQLAAPETESTPWDEISDADIVTSIELLSEDVRTAFQLHAVDRITYKVIAQRLGVPEGTVATYIRRARKQLGELLRARKRTL